MFGIFNKRAAAQSGTNRPGGHGPAASPRTMADPDETFHLDIPVDEAMRSLDARLSSLAHLDVAQAAKERGWATLHRELARHPVRATSPALLKGTGRKTPASPGGLAPVPAGTGHSRSWRIALSSAGALVVILAAVLGIYGAGLIDGPGPVADTTSTVIAELPSTTETPVTEVTPPTGETVTTAGAGTTEVTPASTETSTTEVTPPTDGTSPSTPVTGTTPTTKPTTTPTTKPASTTTTGPTVNVSASRIKEAKVLASLLAKSIVDYFAGVAELSDASRHVDAGAQAALRQMIGRLERPNSAQVLPGSEKGIDEHTVRLTLEFVDVSETLRFFVWVRVDDAGAIITKITAAS